MRTMGFIVFVSVVLAVYGLANAYIFVRGLQALPKGTPLAAAYWIVFFILALAYIAGRILEAVRLSAISGALIWIGSFWLAAILYFFLISAALDLIGLAARWIPAFGSWTAAHAKIRPVLLASAVGLVAVVLAAGHINAARIRVRTLRLDIEKPANGLSGLRIAVASDIHLGAIVGASRLERIVETINAIDPDVVLLAGDVVDEDLKRVILRDLGEALGRIRSRYGVYAVTGNHEYIGGVEDACAYLSRHRVRVLRDEAIEVNGRFCLVGREDRSIRQFNGSKRKSLEALVKGIDERLPVILMDHQPFRLEEAEGNGIDLQISGHTHHGQLWPLNFVTERVYELSRGYARKQGTHFYVSSGAGTWGPPVRTGSTPEIVQILLRFSGGPRQSVGGD